VNLVNMNKENWEKEFNKKFGKKNSYGLYKVDRPTEYKKIKQFIQNLLDKQREEIKERIGKMKLPNKEINYKHKRDFLGKYDNGYNQALSDILKELNK